jgi:hypothetical protein
LSAGVSVANRATLMSEQTGAAMYPNERPIPNSAAYVNFRHRLIERFKRLLGRAPTIQERGWLKDYAGALADRYTAINGTSNVWWDTRRTSAYERNNGTTSEQKEPTHEPQAGRPDDHR